MLIPYFWAEARLQNKLPERQITVRRWGWSDISQADAQALADQRAQEAMNRIQSGEPLRRREPKAAYDCADGVPIREEVVSRHGNTVITRNSYGSLCLNAPSVFFADVDAEWHPSLQMSMRGCLLMAATGVAAGVLLKSALTGFAMVIGLPWLTSWIIDRINAKHRSAAEAGEKKRALGVIRAFSAAHPLWHLRVYETPVGYRLLAMHEVFEPAEESCQKAFEELNTDKVFMRLCAVQGCFRARVSPKYWRMKYRLPLSLPKSKWPFPAEHVPLRQRWIAAYEEHAPRYASCRFIETLGSRVTHPEAEAVREVHDEYCQAHSNLPLA